MRTWFFCTFCLLILSAPFSAPLLTAAEQKNNIPRFASIRSNEVNLRRGPGTQYPHDWIYVRTGLPIEVIAEYDTWRKIRDHEGTEGWVHQAMLSGRRNVIVTALSAKLYKNAEPNPHHVIAVVEKNVIGRVLECKNHMCKVKIGGYKGWLHRHEIWGIRPDEEKIK
jgi:SH3-like domain-containing protein